jgi:hypothetical protein
VIIFFFSPTTQSPLKLASRDHLAFLAHDLIDLASVRHIHESLARMSVNWISMQGNNLAPYLKDEKRQSKAQFGSISCWNRL